MGDPLWADRTVYIIGGGPSLIGFDFATLNGGVKLAVNDSVYKTASDAVFSLDQHWIKMNLLTGKLDTYPGEIFCAVQQNYKFQKELNNLTYLRHKIGHGLSGNLGAIHGMNSGFGALNLAILKRAKRIVLLGFDLKIQMVGKEEKTHWHEGYGWYNKDVEVKNYRRWIQEFKDAAMQLCQGNVLVVNANPESSLVGFPKIELSTLSGWDKNE